MLISDMPNVPPVPVIIAQANQAQSGNTTTVRTFGVCSPVPSNYYSLENVVEPIGSAQDYFNMYEYRTVAGPATVTIVQQPAHGVLRLVTEADRGTLFSSSSDPLDPTNPGYAYLPDPSYVGKDSATVQVDFGNGLKVNVKYYFQAVDHPLGNTGLMDACKKTGVYWKISSTLDSNGITNDLAGVVGQPSQMASSSINSTIASVKYQSPIINASASTTRRPSTVMATGKSPDR